MPDSTVVFFACCTISNLFLSVNYLVYSMNITGTVTREFVQPQSPNQFHALTGCLCYSILMFLVFSADDFALSSSSRVCATAAILHGKIVGFNV